MKALNFSPKSHSNASVFCVLFACTLFSTSWAMGSSTLQQARQALSKAASFYASASNLSAEIQVKTVRGEDGKIQNVVGKLWLEGKTRFRLELPGQNFICDGKTLWEQHFAHKQVVIRNAGGEGERMNPAQLLTRFLECEPLALDTLPWKKSKGKNALRISLNPTRVAKNISSMSLVIDSKNGAPLQLETEDKEQNQSFYELAQVSINSVPIKGKARDIWNQKFNLVIPPGVETIDMR